MKHPVQKLCIVHSKHGDFLLVASGATISSIELKEGRLTSQWPIDLECSEDEGDRPAKRQKTDIDGRQLSRQQSEASDASIEIVAERKKGERKKSKFIDTKLPSVSHLMTTSDGDYVIGVTAEDKCIRVFQITELGRLVQLSSRSLPKKLCAVRLTKDENVILAADKFGDVYAIPLYQSEDWAPKTREQNGTAYKPSASELTVHTKGNLEALRQQLKQKESRARKDGPGFDHQVILGHVSLLTDLVVGEGIVNGKPRPYILTSDRDEHIRVSRGMPQAHIIENFCLGHLEFVTRLCIPPARSELLIAGNGETSLRVYNWQTGELVDSALLRAVVPAELNTEGNAYEQSLLPEQRSHEKLAVSGIWPINFSRTTNSKGKEESLILVALEGIPLLLTYVLDADGLNISEGIKLKGNVLDVVVLDERKQVVVSIDNVHKPYSMKSYMSSDEAQSSPFQLFELQTREKQASLSGKFEWQAIDVPFNMSEIIRALPEAPDPVEEESGRNRGYEKIFSGLGEFLYGLENLRKKRDGTAEEEIPMGAEDIETARPKEVV